MLTDLRYGEAVWADDSTILFVRAAGSSASSADVDASLSDKKQKKAWAASERDEPAIEIWAHVVDAASEPYRVASLPVDEIGDFKLRALSPSHALLGFSSPMYASDPTLRGYAKAKQAWEDAKEGAEVRVFDKLYARHWDSWFEGKRNKLFVARLRKVDGRWTFGLDDVTSPLAADPRLQVPTPPFGDASDFDISDTHVVVSAKDPELNEGAQDAD